MLMSSEITQCLHSTLGHLFALRKLLHSSHHSYSLFHHSPTQAKETQNKHSIPTDTTIQQKKNKRRGGAPPYHQPNTTTAIHFQQLIIHHKIDLKSTENPTKNQAKPTVSATIAAVRSAIVVAAADLPCCCPDLLASAAGFSAMCEFWV